MEEVNAFEYFGLSLYKRGSMERESYERKLYKGGMYDERQNSKYGDKEGTA